MMEDMATETVAGGIAGAVGIVATQPLDTIRIRLQSSATGLGKTYSGVANCAADTLRSEGIRGLYKGVASPTLTVAAMNAVLFLGYESTCKIFRQRNAPGEELSLAQVAAAGSVAGFTTAFITGPTELVKCVAQTNLRSKGLIREEWWILRDMVRTHGVFGHHGPCRGLLTTMVRETPAFGLYFWLYENITRRLSRHDGRLVSLFAGGVAGATAWASIYPIDVVKTRWSTAAPGVYASIYHCVRSSVDAEGYRVLLKGFGATMIRAFPQNAVLFFTYEQVKAAIAGFSGG